MISLNVDSGVRIIMYFYRINKGFDLKFRRYYILRTPEEDWIVQLSKLCECNNTSSNEIETINNNFLLKKFRKKCILT